MGTDIHGYLEVRWPEDPIWRAIDSVPELLDALIIPDRDDNAWGCLFGVRNNTGLHPIAASRGIPPDASDRVRREFAPPRVGLAMHSPTWADIGEIDRMDLDEQSQRLSLTIPSVNQGRVEYLPAASRPAGISDSAWKALQQGQTVEVANFSNQSIDAKLKMVSLTRGAAVANYTPIFRLMRSLSRHCGGKENVRLVVWFVD